MATEIERKFLVKTDLWARPERGTRLVQGYLTTSGRSTVRVRIAEDHAFVTIKGRSLGISRAEFEYEIPVEDAEELLALSETPLVDKVRYLTEHEGHTFEVDVFAGENAGLVVAEIELSSEGESFASPAWLGREVSFDRRFANSALATVPYGRWPEHERPTA
jgi:adenylate cyclase